MTQVGIWLQASCATVRLLIDGLVAVFGSAMMATTFALSLSLFAHLRHIVKTFTSEPHSDLDEGSGTRLANKIRTPSRLLCCYPTVSHVRQQNQSTYQCTAHVRPTLAWHHR